jgi:hypothetical protein
MDAISGGRFLVDTGAALTFIKEELLTMQVESLAWIGGVNFHQGGAVNHASGILALARSC